MNSFVFSCLQILLKDERFTIERSSINIVAFVVLTFVCTEMLTIIRDKSNIGRVLEKVLFIFCRKQVLASALITSDNNY